jgi:hypothetical protein
VLSLPHSEPNGGAYDVRQLQQRIEPALQALDAAGIYSIELGTLERKPRLRGSFTTLVELGIDLGFAREPVPGESPHISVGAPVGGFTSADLVASAIEAEAGKPDNQAKLQEPPGAMRRHLFVVFDSSSGSYFNAVDRQMTGRLPQLPAPITTAWAASGGYVLVTTPPDPWQIHELPPVVFDDPDSFLAAATMPP